MPTLLSILLLCALIPWTPRMTTAAPALSTADDERTRAPLSDQRPHEPGDGRGPAPAVSIDTTPGWSGGGYIFGAGGYYGQVFTVPPGQPVLDAFTFFLSGSEPAIAFTAEIAPWDPATFASGPALYTSEARTNAGFPLYTGAVSGYAPVTFTIAGGLPLTPGAQYVAILAAATGGGSAAIGNNFDVDAYPGGYHLFGAPPQGWYNADDTRDYAFRATFVPAAPLPWLSVPAGVFFHPTGLYAAPGTSWLVSAQGVVDLSALNGGYLTTPDGTLVMTPPADSGAFAFFRDRAGPLDTDPVLGSRKSFLPLTGDLPGHLPGAPYGALVAGFSPTASPTSFADFPQGFALVGPRGVAQAPNTGGYLFLGVNDFNNPGGDNAGAFLVRLFRLPEPLSPPVHR